MAHVIDLLGVSRDALMRFIEAWQPHTIALGVLLALRYDFVAC